ncbi:universal stress protein family-domain-containing protein [Scenedesmus sp. NREL 46B-D3]|nr:universal stress protein family-domain-containing protein [Scenedesmus sp. NREL 46B-D3]
MPSTLEEAYLQKNPKKNLVVGVAIDGSNISDKALATACGFYNAARGDRLVILHVSDSTKTFLPRHLQPKHLESQYVEKGRSLKARAEWACHDKGAGSSTCQALMALAQEQRVDLLVVGSFGRKGERVDMLGTVSDYSLREGHSSVAIVRSSARASPPGSRRYMFATDGSRAAAVAFLTLCHQLVRPGDRVLLVSCSYDHQPASGPDYFKHYTAVAEKLQIPVETLSWRVERDQSMSTGLLQLVALREVDCLVCGISGYSQKKLGSVSDEITRYALCNTIVIKDAHEVLSHQFNTAGARGISDAILPAGSSRKQLKA